MPRPTAVRAPATRDQADAYRFGLRRMETALVRADSVPLNEHIRTQRRSAVAGVAVGLLALCAAALYTVLAPSPDWQGKAVVTASGSGDMYAVLGNPDRLVPVTNLPAARLVLAAAGRTGDAATATPVEIAAGKVAKARTTSPAGLAGADGVQPGSSLTGGWAICDQVTPDGVLDATTVVGGIAAPQPAAPDSGVLVSTPDDTTWLITDGRRYQVDAGDGALLAAYGLSRVVPRAVDPQLLGLLPKGPELATPTVPDRGDPAPAGLPGRVGDVLVSRSGTGDPRYFVVLSRGLQRVPQVVAGLLRVASGARAAKDVDAGVVAGARLRTDLPVDGWPAAAPQLQGPTRAPVLCWSWAGDPAGQVWTGTSLPAGPAQPVPLDKADGPGPAVDAVAVGSGGAVSVAAETPTSRPSTGKSSSTTAQTAVEGSNHTLRSAVKPALDDGSAADSPTDRTGSRSAQVAGAGPDNAPDDSGAGAGSTAPEDAIWLVSRAGTAYPVVDGATASALGVTQAEPAPAALIDLLPAGPPLDLGAATTAVAAILR